MAARQTESTLVDTEAKKVHRRPSGRPIYNPIGARDPAAEQMDNVHAPVNDFVHTRSREDIIRVLERVMKLYLPHRKYVTIDFCKKVISKKLYLVKTGDLRTVFVPQYVELKIDSVWASIQNDLVFRRFIPVREHKPHVNRQYFWDVLNTLYPDYVDSLIDLAYEERSAKERPVEE
jgi:hypothetical protein